MRFCALRGTAQGAGFAAPQQQLSRPCCPTRPQNACKGVHAVDRLSLHRAASLGLRAHPCAPLTARGQGLARAVADGAVPSLPPEQEQEAATVGASPGSHDRHSMGSDNEDEQLARARQQLEQMQVDVAQSGSAWRAAGDVDRFIQAFELLTNQCLPDVGQAALPASASPLAPQCRAALHQLATHFLPLVDSLATARECLTPLEACALLSYGWGDGSDGEVPLAVGLLRRLGADPHALLPAPGDHIRLWGALAHAPRSGVAPHRRVLEEVSMSATQLQWSVEECAAVVQLCAEGRHAAEALLHHVAGVVAGRNPSLDQLARVLHSLGKLHVECGHVPDPQHVQVLAQMAAECLGEEQAGASNQPHREQQQQEQQQEQKQKQQQEQEEDGDKQGLHVPRMEVVLLLLVAYWRLNFTGIKWSALSPLAAAVAEGARDMTLQQHLAALESLGSLLRCSPGGVAVLGRAVQGVAAEVQRRVEGAGPGAGEWQPQLVLGLLESLAVWRRPLRASATGKGVEAAARALAELCRSLGFPAWSFGDIIRAALLRLPFRFEDQEWYDAMIPAAARAAANEDPGSVALWSHLWFVLSVARHRPDEQLVRCTEDALAAVQAESVEPSLLAGLLRSVASLGVGNLQLVRLLLQRLAEALPGGRVAGSDLARALWAAAVLGPEVLCASAQEVEVLLREVVRRWQGAEEGAVPFEEKSLLVLAQVQQELERLADTIHGSSGDDASHAAALHQFLPTAVGGGGRQGVARPALLATADAAVAPLGAGPRTATFAAVYTSLVRMQRQQRRKAGAADAAQPVITGVFQQAVVDGLRCRRVELLVELASGRRVAVEVEGREAFLANEPHTRTRVGAGQLRRRQLERALGEGSVVGLDMEAWSQVAGDEGREDAFMQALLQSALDQQEQTQQQQQAALGPSGAVDSSAAFARFTNRPPPATLAALRQVVEAEVGEWAESRDVRCFKRAFLLVSQVSAPPNTDDAATLALRRSIMHTLATGYLPLLRQSPPMLASLILPLRACVALGYGWGGQQRHTDQAPGAGQEVAPEEVPLVQELLRHLRADGCALVRPAHPRQHNTLWWALHHVPDHALALQQAASEVLAASATAMTALPGEELSAPLCVSLLQSCAANRYFSPPGQLLQRLTATLAACSDASTDDLLEALAALALVRESQPCTLDAGAVRPLAVALRRGLTVQLPPRKLLEILGVCVRLEMPDAVAPLVDTTCRMLGQHAAALKDQEQHDLARTLSVLQQQEHVDAAEAFAAACLPVDEHGRPQGRVPPAQLASGAWVLARAEHTDQGWFAAVVQAALGPAFAEEATAGDWVVLWEALAEARHFPVDSLYERLWLLLNMTGAGEGHGGPPKPALLLRAEDAASLLRSLAVLGAPDGRLSQLLLRCAAGGRARLSGEALCSVLWAAAVGGAGALAASGYRVQQLLEEVVRRWEQGGEGEGEGQSEDGLEEVGQGGLLPKDALVQLWQVQLELEALAREREGDENLGDLGELLPRAGAREGSGPRLMEAVEGAVRQRQQQEVEQLVTCGDTRQVLEALQRVQEGVGEGDGEVSIRSAWLAAPVHKLGCAVGVLVELADGRRVAVEVEGREAFLANEPHTHTRVGAAQLKRRQLMRCFGAANTLFVRPPVTAGSRTRQQAAEQLQGALVSALVRSHALGVAQALVRPQEQQQQQVQQEQQSTEALEVKEEMRKPGVRAVKRRRMVPASITPVEEDW